ncbi:hypothetical protein dsat_1443 [Alkalidesulfovibrio alkalitolerans DSM 16529]|uniref:Uncharacterized protein n=1 Tax=Alkalidesulfovibrio alkalitolerans DSM 16529 TaxID=1121439 RepID=S7T2A9_9BACT|nr:hypothetical protein [Alkalidesulfovibrio alkalitolerans]EPR30721.1 hypothetical protein dsat_1443 [Alkalidesulfovibrio alkalitolerans DSM 16529]
MSLHLMFRITNCLQTILELEPQLERLELGKDLLKEFEQLKSFLSKVNHIDLHEDDVARIESATASFLDELRGPLTAIDRTGSQARFLQ